MVLSNHRYKKAAGKEKKEETRQKPDILLHQAKEPSFLYRRRSILTKIVSAKADVGVTIGELLQCPLSQKQLPEGCEAQSVSVCLKKIIGIFPRSSTLFRELMY